MQKTASKDGTAIAYDRQGAGPTLILVDGAMTARASGSKPELARLLSPHFTVISYDRRGRGDSGDTQPYAVAREIEDIGALIRENGGTAYLYGHSSGACLAMEAAIQLGNAVKKLAMYEPPYNSDPTSKAAWVHYLEELPKLLAAGRNGDAAALFMRFTGVPENQIDAMRQAPYWPGIEAIAPTLVYDHAEIMGADLSVPLDRTARVRVPTLVMNGSASFDFMQPSAQALAGAIPQAQHRILPGQTHNVYPEVLAPVLIEFFSGS
jgi:pimeloyl-ACP methyl ester carboxylesterase